MLKAYHLLDEIYLSFSTKKAYQMKCTCLCIFKQKLIRWRT